jgi:hypothetical protein
VTDFSWCTCTVCLGHCLGGSEVAQRAFRFIDESQQTSACGGRCDGSTSTEGRCGAGLPPAYLKVVKGKRAGSAR